MPITEELKNVKEFESVGFSHEQAETLADVIEQSHAQSHESLKEFIRNEFEKQTKDIDIKFSTFDLKLSSIDNKLSKEISNLEVSMSANQKDISKQISALEVSIATSQKDLLIKLFGIIVGTVGVAVTILKLF
ncbi:MAG: hypothetical protein ACUZ8O_01325 [Candidatus Anammoxibacter sp.]